MKHHKVWPNNMKICCDSKVKMCMSFCSTNWPQPHVLIRLSEKYWLGQNLSFNLHWHQWNRKCLMLTPDCGPSKHPHGVASRWVEYGLINGQAGSVEQEQDHISNIRRTIWNLALGNTDAVSKKSKNCVRLVHQNGKKYILRAKMQHWVRQFELY